MIDLEQMRKIAKVIDDRCRDAMGDSGIDPADFEVVQKYLDAGILQYKKKPRGWLQRDIYFPTLMDPELEGLVGGAWLVLLRDSIKRWKVPSKIGPASVTEYINKWYEYGLPDYTKVVTNGYAGSKEVSRQLELVEIVLKERK